MTQDVAQATRAFLHVMDRQEGAPKIRRIEDLPSVFDVERLERSFTVEGCIPEASVILLTSESGQGKTMLALQASAHVAMGLPFCGLETSQRPVLYLDRENPAHVIAERLRMFHAEAAPLWIWGQWCDEEAPPANCQIVTEWVRVCNPKPLIVVDSLIAFHPGAENDSAETRQYMHGFRQLAGMGATVLLLHHSGKAETSKDYRGSSDIKAAVDIGYHLANVGDPSRLELVRLRAFKQRFPVREDLVLNFGSHGFGLCPETARVSVNDLLIEILKTNSGIGATEFEQLAAEKDIASKRARQFLRTNAEAGRVRVTKGDYNAKYHTWVEREETLY